MTSRNPFTLLGATALIPLTALAVAGCGGGGSAAAAPAHTPATTTVARHAPAVHVATTRLGKILVNSRGRTVYLFTKDSGTKSSCSGACATAWPPLRANGKQVIYKGHPL